MTRRVVAEAIIANDQGRFRLALKPNTELRDEDRKRIERAFARSAEIWPPNRSDLDGERIEIETGGVLPSIESLRNLGAFSGLDFSPGVVLGFWAYPPPAINLYPFQTVGRDWLLQVGRGILADDMGLGKTVQAIAAVVQGLWELRFSRVLVVAPRSLAFNWYAEFLRWAPSLPISLVLPSGSGSAPTWARRVGNSSVVVTTYEQVRDNAEVLQGNFDLVIADEAHRVRNSGSALSKAFSHLDSTNLWLLTGTPLERDVEDLLTLLSHLYPGRFSLRDKRLDPTVIRSSSRPYVLRRKKDDVLSDLPAMTLRHEFVQLADAQAREYREALAWTRGQNPLERYDRLRSICDVASNGESAKIDRILEILLEIGDLGESAVVFSFWDEPLQVLRRRIEKATKENLHFYHSSLTLIERNEVVQRFLAEGGIFLASGRIAAEGLTLVEANHVIFLNRWWNPSLNRQAADRIRRIGQTRPTFTYTFSAPGTVDIALDAMLQSKSIAENTFVELLSDQLDDEG